MTIDLAQMASHIVSERPPSYDLLGDSTRRWPIVYMTPPWLFPHRSAKGDSRKPGGSSTPSLSFEDIARIPIPTLIEKDAVVFVWTPDTQLPKVLSLFDVWGLRYNGTAFHWTRTREDTDLTCMHYERDIPIYTGYITRGNPIALVMGVKGEPSLRKHRMEDGTVRPRKDIRKQQFAPYTSGAAHPRFRELVEQLYDGPYLELFGSGRKGWDHWIPETS